MLEIARIKTKQHDVDVRHRNAIVDIKLARARQAVDAQLAVQRIQTSLSLATEERHGEEEARRKRLIDWWSQNRKGQFVAENLIYGTQQRMRHEPHPGQHFVGVMSSSVSLHPRRWDEDWVGLENSPQRGLPIIKPLERGSRVPIPHRGAREQGEHYISPDEVENTWIRVEIAAGLGSSGRRRGWVRFVGVVHFASGEWVGVELDHMYGRNNGSVDGVSYFNCVNEYGVFVRQGQATRVQTGTYPP